MRLKNKCLVLATLLFISFSGLSQAGVKEDLSKRVQLLCQAKKNNQWDVAYDIFSSAYKSTITKEKFLKKRRGVVFGDCVIVGVDISTDGDSAKVSVTSDATIAGSFFKNALSYQHWTFEDDNWYQIVSDGFKGLFSPSKKVKSKKAKE